MKTKKITTSLAIKQEESIEIVLNTVKNGPYHASTNLHRVPGKERSMWNGEAEEILAVRELIFGHDPEFLELFDGLTLREMHEVSRSLMNAGISFQMERAQTALEKACKRYGIKAKFRLCP